MARTFTVKTITGIKQTVTDEGCDNLEQFSSKILDAFEGWKEKYVGAKVVYSGKVLEDEAFKLLASDLELIVVPTKKKKTVVSSTPPTSESKEPTVEEKKEEGDSKSTDDSKTDETSGESSDSTVENELDKMMSNKKCTYQQAHAAILVLMKLVRDNPQLYKAFTEDFGTFFNTVNQAQFKGIACDILDQSGAIINAQKSGGTIAINVGGDTPTSVGDVSLTPADQENIQKLIEMGFPPELVVQVFVQSDKDFNTTLEKLFAMGSM
jgi:hypothetical protein